MKSQYRCANRFTSRTRYHYDCSISEPEERDAECLVEGRPPRAAQSLRLAVEKAIETVGGAAFFRSMGLERLLRDIHAAQFHPLQPRAQHRFSGRVALGLDPVG